MKRCVVVMLLALILATGAQATMLLGRSGTTLKPFQIFGWVNGGYSQTASAYNWDSTKYTDLSAASRVKTLQADLNVMLGLPGKVEFGLDVPVASKTQDTLESSGTGDVMLIARYGLLQAKILPVKVALVLGANVPTATKAESPKPSLGDRTFDVGFGFSAVTSKLGPFVGHARAAYWFNGKTNDTTKLGNTVEYSLTGDYYLTPTVIPELCLSGTMQRQRQDNGIATAHTEASQHSLALLVLTKPLPFLVVRPKAGLPLASVSKGGSLPKFTVGLDAWVTLP
jgi:hypothetical protein